MSGHKLCADIADHDLARRLVGALQDLLEPAPDALTLFEASEAGPQSPRGWRIEAYYQEPPEPETLRQRLQSVVGQPVPRFVASPVPDLNWVALSQAALPPVAAGRFTVFGSHDRHRVARGPWSILIDAGEAFGTAHHATTAGCLAAVDRVTRRTHFARVLDLGCGSGVLAIAVARALPKAAVVASDIDAQSVAVARANMRNNAVAGRIATLVAEGLDSATLRRPSRFDLIVANILADPLIRLAPRLTRALAPGGTLILSGLLIPQAAAVIAAYRAQGVAVSRHDRLAGWSTLTLMRRSL